MLFRIPAHLKEKVTIVRKSAYERGQETLIATDVVCMIIPKTDTYQIIDGVGVSAVEWTALLETPNSDISEGDVVRRTDTSELQVRRVRTLGSVMQLELKDDNVV